MLAGLAFGVALAAFDLGPLAGSRAAMAQSGCGNVLVRTPYRGDAIPSGPVQILGSAQFDGFYFYKLEWANSLDPSDWRAIGETHSEPRSNALLEEWDTSRLPDGRYQVKLTAVNQFSEEVCKYTVTDLSLDRSVPLTPDTTQANALDSLSEEDGTPTDSATATDEPTEAATEEPTPAEETSGAAGTPGATPEAPGSGTPTAEADADLVAVDEIDPFTQTEDMLDKVLKLGVDGIVGGFVNGFLWALGLAVVLLAVHAFRRRR